MIAPLAQRREELLLDVAHEFHAMRTLRNFAEKGLALLDVTREADGYCLDAPDDLAAGSTRLGFDALAFSARWRRGDSDAPCPFAAALRNVCDDIWLTHE